MGQHMGYGIWPTLNFSALIWLVVEVGFFEFFASECPAEIDKIDTYEKQYKIISSSNQTIAH
jgi:hypothetical protein